MSPRPKLISLDVGDAELGALHWPSDDLAAPTVVAVHGITANAWHWDLVAHRLAGDVSLVAVDLRGRGRSHEQPAPVGMRQHADDIARVITEIGEPGQPLLVVGHSMGCYVALMVAERHPRSVADVVLVDGGTRLAVPPDADVDDVLDQMLGPAIDRLRTTWPDRVAYRTMWAQHPAYSDGIGVNLERNLLADLVEVEGGFRTAVNEEAVRVDGRELLADEEIRSLLERRSTRTTIVRSPNGLLGGPPPLIPDETVAALDRHDWHTVDETNHYTVLLGTRGAEVVADQIRSTAGLTSSESRP